MPHLIVVQVMLHRQLIDAIRGKRVGVGCLGYTKVCGAIYSAGARNEDNLFYFMFYDLLHKVKKRKQVLFYLYQRIVPTG